MSSTVSKPLQQAEGVRPRRVNLEVLQRRLGITCVVGACLFVFWQLRPDLIFSATTPAGGDMAAHVWGPAYMRDHLLPLGRLTGWSPDWYAGFPAFHFYMVLPALAIALLSFVVPYGVAFKLVAVAGLVAMPLAAATFVRLAGLRFPTPTIAAMLTLPFLFDFSFSIYGGNIASTMAGEFAYSISLSLMLVYLGVLLRGLRTGRHRVLAGVLLALVGLTHLIPAIFAVVATGVALAMQPGRRQLRWLVISGALAAMFAAFWLLPFWWRRDYYHNINWINVPQYWSNLIREDWGWTWVLIGAWVGLLVGILRRQRLALYLAALAAIAAAGFRWVPQGELYNVRLLPFYYLSMLLLAAVGVSTLLVTLVSGGSLRDLPTDWPNDAATPSQERKKRRWLPQDSVRLRILLAAALPTVAVVLAIDDLVADNATLRALLEIMPGVEATAVPALAAEVAHLVLLVLIAAAVVAATEILRSLRAQGFRSRSSGPVVLGRPPQRAAAAKKPRPVGSGGRTRGAIRPLGTIAEPSSRAQKVLTLGALGIILIMFLAVAYPLKALGFAGGYTSDGRYGLKVAPNVVLAGTYSYNSVSAWVDWNFSGLEAKQERAGMGGYEEYYRVVAAMSHVAAERGCGRVMWEYGTELLDAYGSPMSLMLLPHWTDGCLASMEGLFFESTWSVPFHFVNQGELSKGPSCPVRAVPCSGMDLYSGIAHLQLFGARYYMAFSEELIAEARFNSDLVEVAAEPPWVMFEVADAPLVSPLAAEPVIVSGTEGDIERWLEVSVDFYREYPYSGATEPGASEPGATQLSPQAVFPAVAGPDNWAEVLPEEPRPVRSLPEVEISDISANQNSIAFRVDQTGVPVLVKASYFPNWQVEGASGPYRVAPNFMVVVPEEAEVKLSYGWTPVDVLAWVITAIGVILALVLWRNPHIWTAEVNRRAPWE